MSNIILIIILAVILFFAIRSSAKHFHGEGDCCGGATYKAKPKKLHSVSARKTLLIEGMSCQNCVNRVMEALNSIDGVSANVKLKSGKAIVSMESAVSDETLKNAVERAGYTVTGIRE